MFGQYSPNLLVKMVQFFWSGNIPTGNKVSFLWNKYINVLVKMSPKFGPYRELSQNSFCKTSEFSKRKLVQNRS